MANGNGPFKGNTGGDPYRNELTKQPFKQLLET
jgi:hypothetical protein